MYGLYGHLLAKGCEVYLNERPTRGDVVAIYPEIQQGNPANASTVVRYILNKPGLVPALLSDGSLQNGPTEFDPNDRLYYFSRLFGDTTEDRYLFLPILNLHIFKDQKKLRTKTAYFVGKAMKDPIWCEQNFIHPQDAVLIDRDLGQDQQALADLLNECQVLYCYDPVSAMTELARLCGVRIVMVNPEYTKEEFSKYEPGMNGISWGKDEEVELWTSSFRSHYESMVRKFSDDLDKFIEEVQR